jgi:hypothetical protein
MGNYDMSQQAIITSSATNTYLVLNALDISESSLVDPLFLQIFLLYKKRVTQQFTALSEQFRPELQNVKIISCAVIATNMHVGFGGLDPPVRGTAAVGLFEKRGPVLDGAEEVADVDEVKGVVVPCPAECGVVDLKLYIGRDPTRDCK